jgi:hypothetical protein
MGNQISSHSEGLKDIQQVHGAQNTNNTNPPPIQRQNTHQTQDVPFLKDYSSYKGLKTDTMTNQNDKSISNDTTSMVTTQEPVNEIKVPTIFQWKDGGKMVYVAGSFSNWTQWFVMTKNPNTGIFELSLDLPKGVHQYKFIVDTKWLFSKNQPTCQDEKGNINNIVDTTSTARPQGEKQQVKDIVVQEKKTEQIEELKKNLAELYTEYYPSKTEMNLDAPNVPSCYANAFDIDRFSHQHLIGNSKFLNFSIRNDQNENNSFKNITIIPHVNL